MGYPATPAASAVATDIVLNPAFQSLQTQIQTLASQVTNNETQDSIRDLGSAVMAGIGSINDNVNGTTRDTLNSIANLSTAQATGNFTTLQSINALGRDITAQANQNALQQLNSFNQLSVSNLQSFNELSRDNANSFNQLNASLATINNNMATCCCEIKSAISADGQATRSLINDLNVQSLNTQLNDAKMQISNSNQTNQFVSALNSTASTIINHLIPRPVVS